MKLHLPLGLLSVLFACYSSAPFAYASSNTIVDSSITITDDNVAAYIDPPNNTLIYGALDGAADSVRINIEIEGSASTDNLRVYGAKNASVENGVEISLDISNNMMQSVYAGDYSSSSQETIKGGTKLTIEDGKFYGYVVAGGAGGTIEGGTQLVINGGSFYGGEVEGGGDGGTINASDGGKAVLVTITGGSFLGVYVAGRMGGVVNGDVELVVTGDTAKFYGGIQGTGDSTIVNGNIDFQLKGGTFSNNIYLGSAPVESRDEDNMDSFDPTANIKYVTPQTIRGNATLTVYNSTLDGFTHTIDGGLLVDENTTGVRSLVINGGSNDLSQATISNFDKIQVTEQGKLTLGTIEDSIPDFVVGEGSTLNLTGTVTGSLSGSGAVNVSDGKFSVTGTATDYMGKTTISGGELALGCIFGSSVELQNGTLSATGATIGDKSVTINGSEEAQLTLTDVADSAIESLALAAGSTLTWSGTHDLTGKAVSLMFTDSNISYTDGSTSATGSPLITADKLTLSVATTELKLSNTKLVELITSHDSVSLNVTSGDLSFAETDDLQSLLQTNNLTILAQVGKVVDKVENGSIVITGGAANVYFAGEAGYASTVTDADAVSAYQAVVLDSNQSLTAELDGSQSTNEMVINNLIGVDGTSLTLTNKSQDSENAIKVVLNNKSITDGEDTNLDDDSDQANSVTTDTLMEGSITAESNIILAKDGEGTLTVDGEVSSETLQVNKGTLALNNESNSLGDVTIATGTLAVGKAALVKSLALTDDASLITLEDEAELTITGDATLDKGSITTAEGASSSIVLGQGASLTVNKTDAIGSLVGITMNGATLDLTSSVTTIRSLSGSGTLKMLAGSILALTGEKASEFTGSLSGEGTLSVENGSLTIAADGGEDFLLSVKNADLTLNPFEGSAQNTPKSLKARAIRLVADAASDSVVPIYKGVEVESNGTLYLGKASSTSSGSALRADLASSATLLKLGDEGLNVNSGGTISLTMNVNSVQELIDQGALVESKGAIVLADKSIVELNNDGTIGSADQKTIRATLMSSETSATVGNVTLNDKVLNSIYKTSLVAEGNDVVLVGEQIEDNAFSSDDSSTSSLPVNAKAGANLLWNARFDLTSGSLLKDVYSSILDLEGDAANKAMAAVAGSTVNSAGTAQRDALRDQLGTIRDRALTVSTDGSQLGHHFWIEGNGGYNHVRTQSDKGGYKLSTWGGTVGADLEATKDLTLGLAFTANYGDLRATAADRTTGDLDSYYLNLFAHYQKNAWGHTLVLTGTTTDADLDRTVDYGAGAYKTQGSTDGYGIGALYELTYDVALNDKGTSLLQPLFDASAVHTSLDGYTESGAGDAGLKVGKQDWTTASLAVGCRWSGSFGTKTVGRTLFGELRTAVSQDFGDKQGKTAVALSGVPDFSQNVYGAKQGSTAWQISGGISTNVGQNGTVYANAGAELRNDANSVHGNVGYRYSF
jgi:outer membrane autotransporter protein